MLLIPLILLGSWFHVSVALHLNPALVNCNLGIVVVIMLLSSSCTFGAMCSYFPILTVFHSCIVEWYLMSSLIDIQLQSFRRVVTLVLFPLAVTHLAILFCSLCAWVM